MSNLSGPNVPKEVAERAAQQCAPQVCGRTARSFIGCGVWNGPADSAGIVIGQAYTVIYEVEYTGSRITAQGYASTVEGAIALAIEGFYESFYNHFPTTSEICTS